ncbi:hypothetical protein BHE74_00006046 [Ensete ventricosum]|uniref:Uncharacterized protein n=1 Tax=Ensete ventricosum TaxID=4639 RepID=A0A426ZPG9_ENSVE|nr:hypothetical protein B296_00020987 [Ensete ventricosum]RWW85286.1 hypothetical protein BHE74_00006046 [Ensete ventricosum]RZS03431.1 hypothetical protein BHM03_00033611 [Ensete ventricosum]
MAEPQDDTHVVEIPAAAGAEPRRHSDGDDNALVVIQHHPLTQISESPGHLLLLKLWQREEDLHGRRAAALEARMDGAKREAFHLSCLFLAFHGLSLTLLFAASVAGDACRDWWVPSCLSLLTSLVLVGAVHARVRAYWGLSRLLQRDRADGRALARCVQELRMKGASFDLSKEPQTSKRMKSSSVEVKWPPLRWCSQNLVTICLLCVAGIVFPACRFILCG